MLIQRIHQEYRRLWDANAPLTATAVIMLAAFIGSVAGLFIDPRIITGVPAWLKPAKFGISTAIYAASIAWLLRYITVWPRFTRAMGWVLAMVLNTEVGIIDLQAARGTTSHFNYSTPLDAALFGVMAVAIAILWLANVGLVVALFRQHFDDTGWGWALRLGLSITVLGASVGGIMVQPTAKQLENTRPTIIGAHTVGGPDGGPGLPGVGWSTEHGDLRIAHFVGLHALQVIPFLAWFLRRRHSSSSAVAFAVAGSYLALAGILAWQALRGEPITAPQPATLAAFAIWLAGTAAGLIATLARLGRAEALA